MKALYCVIRHTTLFLFSILLLAAHGQQPRYTPRYATIAHQVLQLEELRLSDKKLDARYDSIYRFLDELADRCTTAVHYDSAKNSPDYARKVILSIHDFLLDEGMIFGRPANTYHASLKTIDRNDKLFRVSMRPADARKILQRPAAVFRQADCDVSVLLYMIVAERLRLPVTAVWMPAHMVLRWQVPGGDHINVETQYARVGPDDDGYRVKYNVRPAEEELFGYMRPLQPAELKAVYCMMFALKQDNYPPADGPLKETFLLKGYSLRPDWPLPRVAYIKHWIESGDSTLTLRAAELAAGLANITSAHPAYLHAYAYTRLRTGHGEVKSLLEEAEQKLPSDGTWPYLLGYADMKAGNREKACAGFRKAKELGYKGFWEKAVRDFMIAACGARPE